MMIKVAAIIQARMSSTRLPGKVLLPLAGKPVIQHIVDRLKLCRSVRDIVVATSVDSSDDILAQFCTSQNINIFRGPLDDVLTRYAEAAFEYKADYVVRITADCPVIDPIIVDAIVTCALCGQYDLFSLGGSFPDGLDCSVFSVNALATASRLAKLKSEREHVGPFVEKNPELFKIGHIELLKDLGHHRWTLDEPDDYKVLELIYNNLYGEQNIFLTKDILDLFDRHPDLLDINTHIIRNAGYAKSLKEDEISNDTF